MASWGRFSGSFGFEGDGEVSRQGAKTARGDRGEEDFWCGVCAGSGSFCRGGWAGVEDDPRHPWVRFVGADGLGARTIPGTVGSLCRGGWAGVEDDPGTRGFVLSGGWVGREPGTVGSFCRGGWAGGEDDPRHPWVRFVGGDGLGARTIPGTRGFVWLRWVRGEVGRLMGFRARGGSKVFLLSIRKSVWIERRKMDFGVGFGVSKTGGGPAYQRPAGSQEIAYVIIMILW